MTYGDQFIVWRLGFLVWIDRNKCPNNPTGFFGLIGPLAIQYDFTEI